jgi:hypothetical protein
LFTEIRSLRIDGGEKVAVSHGNGDGTAVLEAFNMKIILFLIFVAACYGLLTWLSKKSKTEIDQAKIKRRQRERQAKTLLAPAKEASPHRYEIWHSQRPDAKTGEVNNPLLVPSDSSDVAEESDYDDHSLKEWLEQSEASSVPVKKEKPHHHRQPLSS